MIAIKLSRNVNLSSPPIRIKQLDLCDYLQIWEAMKAFTAQRSADTEDQLWFLQHRPVFTLGLNGKPEHVLNAGDIPVIQCDRGGQVTYHGPGQLVCYTLLDLQRRHLGVKQLVYWLEQTVIDLLATYQITGERKPGAPGIYVDGAKIAALGLRVRRGCCYHGLSLNIDMDLEPFSRINPCGYSGLATTQLKTFVPNPDVNRISRQLASLFQQKLSTP